MKRYAVYKGLQKPLVFRGFKGRYIYWGVGYILLSIVGAGITAAAFNLVAGIFVLAAVMAGGLYHTSIRQKNGLHDKTKSKGVFVFQTNLNGIRNVKKETV